VLERRSVALWDWRSYVREGSLQAARLICLLLAIVIAFKKPDHLAARLAALLLASSAIIALPSVGQVPLVRSLPLPLEIVAAFCCPSSPSSRRPSGSVSSPASATTLDPAVALVRGGAAGCAGWITAGDRPDSQSAVVDIAIDVAWSIRRRGARHHGAGTRGHGNPRREPPARSGPERAT
jgi:hypothetical protein